jgi:hypothetical protein
MRKFEAKDIEIIRPAAAINPLMTYNFTGNSDGIFPNDALIQHGDYGYVGGDTVEFTFDFGTKIANSVAECPMKYYYGVSPTLNSPADIPKWFEATSQSYLDRLKTQDGSIDLLSNAVSGNIAQLLVELDLTPICNRFYGGSNAAMKAGLKSIQADVWAMGSGVNAGVKADGVIVKMWSNTSGGWYFDASSTSGSISKIISQATSGAPNIVNTSNKLYILIASQYASDGTIASSVSLDYLSIKISLARTAETVKPKTVNLGKTWALLIKGFSPAWDSVNPKVTGKIFTLYKDAINIFYSHITNGTLKFIQVCNNVTSYAEIPLSSIPFSKNQTINLIFAKPVQGLSMYVLVNGKIVQKVTLSNGDFITGSFEFYPLKYESTAYNADAFTEAFHLIPDLQAMGKSNGFTDAEAEGILRGVLKGKNLFDKSKRMQGYYLELSSGQPVPSTVSDISDYIMVNPNTSYIISGVTDNTNRTLSFYDSSNAHVSGIAPSRNIMFTTPSNVRYVRLTVPKADIDKIQLEEGSVATAYEPYLENPLRIVNKNLFSLDKVQLHPNARIEGNSIVLEATAGNQQSYIDIPVLPNNKYEISFKKVGSGGYAYINVMYNSIVMQNNIFSTFSDRTNDGIKTSTFITPNNSNILRVFCTSTVAGTFKFSDIEVTVKM